MSPDTLTNLAKAATVALWAGLFLFAWVVTP